MNIRHIEISNFKNFVDISLDFANGVNLFVGKNGCGKTSVLEAVNVAVGGFFGSQEQKMQRTIDFSEIRVFMGRREAFARVKAESVDVGYPWSRTINRDTRANDTKHIKPVSDYGSVVFDAFNHLDDRTLAPLIAYYSTQRLFRDAYMSGKQKYDAAAGRRNGYLQCLRESAIKAVLNEWLGNAVTRRATMQIKGIEAEDRVLENVEKAIRHALIFFLELKEDFPLKIYQDPDFDNELFLQFEEEHPLPLSFYSDGFRNLLYLVIDLMWRASQLNPWLSFKEITEYTKGVVTIDEIDLHLHPTWQAKAIKLLQNLFPEVQFFITTHSPTVVANFENGALFLIDGKSITPVTTKYFGKEVNAILRNILDAADRHKPTQEKIDRLYRMIDEKAPIQEIMALMNNLIELLGLDDRDIQIANALLDFNTFDNYAIHREG
jgi:predicted ATP-binding protein involved in virulence